MDDSVDRTATFSRVASRSTPIPGVGLEPGCGVYRRPKHEVNYTAVPSYNIPCSTGAQDTYWIMRNKIIRNPGWGVQEKKKFGSRYIEVCVEHTPSDKKPSLGSEFLFPCPVCVFSHKNVLSTSSTTSVRADYLTPLEPQSRLGDKLLEIWAVCPQNGTAVLKGLRSPVIQK